MSRHALAGKYGPAQKDSRKRRKEAPAKLTPLDFALALMRDETQTPALRASMAKAALPYLHERGTEGPPAPEAPKPRMSDLEVARRIAFILTRADSDPRPATATRDQK